MHWTQTSCKGSCGGDSTTVDRMVLRNHDYEPSSSPTFFTPYLEEVAALSFSLQFHWRSTEGGSYCANVRANQLSVL